MYVAIPLYFALLCGVAVFSYRRAKRMEKNNENDKSTFMLIGIILSWTFVVPYALTIDITTIYFSCYSGNLLLQ